MGAQRRNARTAHAGGRSLAFVTHGFESVLRRLGSAGRASRLAQVLPIAALFFVALFAVPVLMAAHTAFGAPIASGGDPVEGVTTWSDFRGSPTNNAITDARTPRTKSQASLLWAAGFEDGYVSPQIIVNDEIIVTSGRGNKGVITKLDKSTGKRIAQASMRNGSSYSLMPPTYADGKVFVTLSDGSIEAFDAETLKSLWYYQNADGGQGNCPVVYSDGCVYTGYWSGETAKRSFVCVDANTGNLVWQQPNDGGYYWAGALVVGDYLLFGCDDGQPVGTAGTSTVRCVNKKTGKAVSSVEVKGDQRSTIVYDEELGCIYFTTKPGLLYSVRLDAETGALSGLRSCKLDIETAATPLVYGGRVYVGASSGGFDKGTLSVLDASTLKMLYQLDGASGIGGTVKSAPLVSIAYADQPDGKLYLYFTINNPPGGITALAVDPGSTELGQARVFTLFTPPEELQQYCISSVICDSDGNLYFRNDSNYLMCVGSSGESSGMHTIPADNTEGNDSEGGQNPNGSEGEGSGEEAMGVTKGGGTIGAVSSSSDKSSSSSADGSASSSSSSSGKSKAGKSSSANADSSKSSSASSDARAGASAPAVAQSDSNRHTDAEAATARLDDADGQDAPAWLAPAIVGGAAVLALLALLVVRMLSTRGREASEGAPEALPDDAAEEANAPHER